MMNVGLVMSRRTLPALALAALLALPLALPLAANAGVEPGLWRIEGEILQKKATCTWAPEPTVTAETVSWPAECTGKKKKSGKVLYTLTITDPFGMVADQCTQELAVPKKKTVAVGCTMPNPGIPVG